MTFAGDANRAVLSRAVASGHLQRIARGIYLPGDDDPVEAVARNWLVILGHEYPGAVIADRSARAMRPLDGKLFVVHPRRSSLDLPGLTIEPRQGPGPVERDIPGPHDVWMSSVERGLLDNLAERAGRVMDQTSVEKWVSGLINQVGEDGINAIRDRARTIAPELKRRVAFDRLNAIISAALTTGPARVLRTPVFRARPFGMLVDEARVERFRVLADHLAGEAPQLLPASDALAARRGLLPFYEAYFSNYIEGTTFTLDEAADIVFDAVIPPRRPEDAHDILGTYQLVSDPRQMARRARSGAELSRLVMEWHAMLMAGRPEAGPGKFRDVEVQAGNTVFVRHELIRGTLETGFEISTSLGDPFSRAAFVHFLISEVHPFRDGNGRISRMAMNAELSAGGETRIIIPTGFRDEYLQSLKAASNNNQFGGAVSVLRFAQRWTAQMDFTSRSTAEPMLQATNALVEPEDSRHYNLKLRLPSHLPQPAAPDPQAAESEAATGAAPAVATFLR